MEVEFVTALAMRRPIPSPLHELRVDASRWPLVAITYRGLPSSAAFEAFLADYRDKVTTRRAPFVAMIDLSDALVPGSSQRESLATCMRALSSAHARWCRAEVFVAPSRVLRVALGVSAWFVRPACPRSVLPSRDAARQRARSLLTEL